MIFSRHAAVMHGASSVLALAAGLALTPAATAQTVPQAPPVGQEQAVPAAPGTAPAATQSGNAQAVEATTETVSTAQDPAAPDTGQPGNEGDVIVTGTRASLQSAAARKKNAGTVVDSIVADDIASFPDKNVGEALARVTGVQLSRDFGEGTQVSIRGVEPDLNRVEINGVSQQSAEGSRAGDFRELQVELVKSIDVFKGYTVDLTEGGIGGTVSIETRRPLDLKRPIFSIKAEGQYQELTKSFKPRVNLLAGGNNYLDGRLGFIFNVTYSDVDTRQDYASNTNWARIADFDRSTNKTVADPLYANFATYESCAGTTGTTAAIASTNRLACETQFFDWAPRIARYRLLDRNDKRVSADFQLQYSVTDNFNVFGQVTHNNRNQQFRDANYSVDLGSDTGSSNVRAIQRFNLDAALPNNAAGGTSRPRPTAGTFTVDEATHTVTSIITNYNGVNAGTAAAPIYTGANSIVGVQRRDFDFDSSSTYYQGGFNWEVGRTKLNFLATRSEAGGINNTNLVSIASGVGGITVDLRNAAGIPVLTFPESFDPANPAAYAVSRTGRNGVALVQAGPTVQYRPTDQGNSEDQLKLDVDFDTSDLPFLKRVEFGGQYRSQNYFRYQGGGARLLRAAVTAVPAAGIVAQPAVFQTSANVSYTTVIGPVPATGPAANTYYLSQAQYQQFIAQNSQVSGGVPLFSGLAVRPDGAPDRLALPIFNYGNLASIYDLSGFDQDLVRFADGLPQIPVYVIDEDIAAGYLKFNFEQEFLGMRLTGNAGARYIYTRDSGTSTNSRSEIRNVPGTGVTLPNGTVVPLQTQTAVVAVQQVTLSNSYTDILPAVNLNLEVFSNLFVRGTYAKNLARPRPTDLSPAVSCTIDTIDSIAGDDTCNAGNPALQPYRADQYDINAAWYPNKDTVVSVGYFYKDIKSFILPAQTRTGVDLFGDGVTYTVRQPVNGFGAKLDGFEVSAQTVFSFLPGFLDGLGATANFTYSRALNSALTNQATNEPLDGFPGLSKYTYNASLFYDKKWLNVKVNYNRRTDWLQTAVDANFGNNPIFRRGETFIDAKVLFRITPQYSISFEALNLGKEYSKTYIDAAKPIEYYYPGQRFFVGAQLKL